MSSDDVSASGEAKKGKKRNRSIFDLSPIKTSKRRKKHLTGGGSPEPKLKKLISEEVKETVEVKPSGLASHSSNTTSSPESKVNQADDIEDLITELLGSCSDGEDEQYEIEYDEVVPLSSLGMDVVTEQLSKSVTSREDGSSQREQVEPTSVKVESSSDKSSKTSPARAKIKHADKKKRKNSPTPKTPESTTQHENTKKPSYKIPKLTNMTKEQMERNRDMPVYAREQGEKEMEEKFQKLFEGIWNINKSLIDVKPSDRTLAKGEIGDEELGELQDEGWDEMKKLNSDEERRRKAKEQFKNLIPTDPGRNLSFQGFKMQKAKQQQGMNMEDIKEERYKRFIDHGVLLPLSELSEVEARTKKLKISEVEVRKKKNIISIFCASEKELVRVKDQVGLFVAHLRSGCDEEKEFLKVYNQVITSHNHLGFFIHLCLV